MAIGPLPSSSESSQPVAENLAAVKARVADTAREAGRASEAVTLVAVSKSHDVARIRPALVAGQRVFGENRVQEAQAKWPALKAEFPGTILHLIGPLQSNKARAAVGLFDVIETVDRLSLAEKLAEEMARQGRRPDCFIQVNTGAEAQKAGVLPEHLPALLNRARDELALPIVGLMCIPPIDDEPAMHFALLRKLAMRHDLAILSMGMSADYQIAIGFEATHIRVGTAIFGARPKRPDGG